MVIVQAARRVNKTSNQSHAPKVDDASDPAGALPPNPRDFLRHDAENQLVVFVQAQHYNQHRWMKRNGALWGHNSARDNSVADKSTLIEHVSDCRLFGNNRACIALFLFFPFCIVSNHIVEDR